MKFKILALILFCCTLSFAAYSQDDVREDIINPDDYSHYLENISDSVQYMKDSWSADLIKINDTDHDYMKIKKNTNALLKFLKDKRHDVKNLGAVGKNGDALKEDYVAYLNAELAAITKYFVPFGEASAQTETNFGKLSNDLKEENEQEKGLVEKLNAAKDAFEQENNLNSESGEE